jgi:hypothetical protein
VPGTAFVGAIVSAVSVPPATGDRIDLDGLGEIARAPA